MQRAWVSVRIWQMPLAETGQRLTDPVSAVADLVFGRAAIERGPSPPPRADSYDTVIEIVTQAAIADDERAAPDLPSACFERGLRALNRLALAYAVWSGDSDFVFASPRSLDSFALTATRPLDAGYGPEAIYLLNSNVAGPKPFLDLPRLEAMSQVTRLLTLGNPFFGPQRLRLAAARAHREGDNATAVVAEASCGELLLNTVLRLLLLEEGGRTFDALIVARPGLANRLKNEYASRLGGRWEIDHPNDPVGAWWQAVEVVRGRVVHAGAWPTHAQADQARAATRALEDFIDHRLVARASRYPKTLLSCVAHSQLKVLGMSPQRIEALEKAHTPEMPTFWKAAGASADMRSPD